MESGIFDEAAEIDVVTPGALANTRCDVVSDDVGIGLMLEAIGWPRYY